MDLLDKILIENSSKMISEKLESNEYRLEFSEARPFISLTSNNRVVCIFNEEVTEQKRDTHYINRAKVFFEAQSEDFKEVALRKIVKSETDRQEELSKDPEASGSQSCASVLAPDAKVLSQNQLQLLKIIYDHSKWGLYFNPDERAIRSRNETCCYVPDRLGSITRCGGKVPLLHYDEILAQWDVISSLKLWPTDPFFTDTSARQQSLPEPARKENVKSIEVVVDYVAGGDHRPLVIFDIDHTIITLDVFEGGETRYVAVAKNTAEIMARIRQKSPNAEIILLTQAGKVKTLEKLTQAGIDQELFESIICVGDMGVDKGDALKNYVKEKKQRPDQICFTDDCVPFLEMVEEASKNLGIQCNTFHFTGAQDAIDRVHAKALGYRSVEQYKMDYS